MVLAVVGYGVAGVVLGNVGALSAIHGVVVLIVLCVDGVVAPPPKLPEQMSVYLDRGYDSETTRERLKSRGLEVMISERETGSASGNKAVGSGEDQLLAKRPQEAHVVYREGRTGHQFLGRLLR